MMFVIVGNMLNRLNMIILRNILQQKHWKAVQSHSIYGVVWVLII